MQTNIKHVFIAYDNTIRKADITYSNIDSKLGEPDTLFIMVDGFRMTDRDPHNMDDLTNTDDVMNFERFELDINILNKNDKFRVLVLKRIKECFEMKRNVLLIDNKCGEYISSILSELGSVEFDYKKINDKI